MPVKTAFNVRLPTGRVAVVTDAAPPLTATGAPMSVDPFSNCTEPVAADGVMVAFSWTDVPNVVGLVGVAVNEVVVGVWTTNKVLPADAL